MGTFTWERRMPGAMGRQDDVVDIGGGIGRDVLGKIDVGHPLASMMRAVGPSREILWDALGLRINSPVLVMMQELVGIIIENQQPRAILPVYLGTCNAIVFWDPDFGDDPGIGTWELHSMSSESKARFITGELGYSDFINLVILEAGTCTTEHTT